MIFSEKNINLNGELLDLKTPVVMGILNVTPDSFYSGSRNTSDKSIIQSAEKIISEGAKIIDIGGYSTRPNAEDISVEEEIRRITSALELIRKRFDNIFISIDTFRSAVARHAVNNFSVEIINDISGGNLDDMMFETIADLDVAYILMHSKGNPRTMQQLVDYDDVVAEVMAYFSKKIGQLQLLGVNDIIIDPGFGFAKTTEQNFILLQKLNYLKELNVPVLAGLSRKSMIYNTLDTTAESALTGTTAANMLALINGASILRVHDVKEAAETVKIYSEFIKAES
jgi:dihydropteroate synthase